ncbi:GNAT family N-acetyltransferase [Actibacterium sp. 188UL27-1]|nr:GNAT family N-acetyltransferase [Actibacterium sp. 188UL27-1]MBM7068136.1 GNAT family N-acetyltransferase [Actibacterium sp. 188UL27-1]
MARLHAAGFDQGRPWRADEFESLLASPTCFGVWTDGAFALGRAVGGEAELLTLVTDPKLRRQGRGRACLGAFEDEARTRHARSAFLEVAEDNHGARQLYAAAGYAGVGIRPNYYRRADQTVAAHLLSKALTSILSR